MVSKKEKRLTEREMWSLGDRNVLQKGRCGVVSIEEWLTEREMWSPGGRNAYRKEDVVSRR